MTLHFQKQKSAKGIWLRSDSFLILDTIKSIFKIVGVEGHQVTHKICYLLIHNFKLLSFSLPALYISVLRNT